MEKVKVGIVGCGNISEVYFKNAKMFDSFDIIACADLDSNLAKQRAEVFEINKVYTTEELLADKEIDLVINLTTPRVHAKIDLAALEAGKHVYGEKPLAVTREEGKKILETAKAKGLLVGSAPDTFLGGGIQTCRKLMDDGWIGDPVSATAFMMNHGHESWHPNPDFYYQEGGGPMFDMGPYYLTALVTLMGPIKRVTGSTKITFPERTITSEPRYGEKIQVKTPTQINGVLDFENGAVASIITSFDTWHHHLPNIEIYGTKGSLVVPDPNTFGGPVFVRRHDQSNWSEIPLTHGFTDNSRGLGVADMAHAILEGRQPRANGDLAFHVLDVMHGFQDASDTNKHYEPIRTCEQPSPLPLD
ncbi:Gfo/Idh/MocA family oxidoreductase [Oceanobacillus caeni]|uniref:Gfo/Idh/MocA family protein n=1 Tax=Oceanobacillus caeni TaxID=405946 RepID=UPI001C24E766|nr:Gfo/Idh/MocA family oxidoreductase [Oceanobacillus caeni]MBU8791421.1 Gfo/Idh/MocA family oxidoreductase [Oceanobacillus caeni]MCR1833783.1 Gfo/Idh/MocA family oxidoreductase [Oceanobacillus caeni]